MSKQLLSTVEAAAYLGVSTNTIRNYIKSGKLKAQRVGPKLLKFRAEDLQRVATDVGLV